MRFVGSGDYWFGIVAVGGGAVSLQYAWVLVYKTRRESTSEGI